MNRLLTIATTEFTIAGLLVAHMLGRGRHGNAIEAYFTRVEAGRAVK